jgi:hypothetical protein
VTAAGRCSAQTEKEAASPPLTPRCCRGPGRGDAPPKDTGPTLSVKAGCDPRATADRSAARHTYARSCGLER